MTTKAKSKSTSKKITQQDVKRIGNRGFVQGFKGELQKVTWPSRPHVTKASLLVVVSMVFATVYVAGVDGLFAKVLLLIKSA